jgi:branched-chain amino acid transport system substrate-binding protein
MIVNRRQLLAASTAMVVSIAASQRAAAAEPIRIGTILSVTGPAAFLGQDMRDGMALAVDEVNASGGILGHPIEWTFYDAQSETQKAITDTRRLLTRDHVDFVVGGGSMSGIAIAMAPMLETAKIPFMATEGASAIIQPVSDREYVFKSTVDDGLVMERLADFFDKKKFHRVALLADNSGFGQGAMEQMKIVAPRRGLDVVYESFAPSDTDLVPQLTRLRDSGAQAIICWTVTPAGVVFLKQARQLGLDTSTQLIHGYGFVTPRYMELAGEAADKLLLVSQKFVVGDQLPDSDPLKPRIQTLTAAFEARFKRVPNQFVAQTYDAIYLAKLAIERSGGDTDKAKIATAMEGIHDYLGTGGVFDFSPGHHSGLAKQNLVMVGWKGGRFVLVDYA